MIAAGSRAVRGAWLAIACVSVAIATPLHAQPVRIAPVVDARRTARTVDVAVRAALAPRVVRALVADSLAPAIDPWFAKDKAKHFGVSAAMQSAGYFTARALGERKNMSLWRASAVTAAIGIGKECWDALGHGDASWKDLTWDGVGLLAGSGLSAGLDRRR